MLVVLAGDTTKATHDVTYNREYNREPSSRLELHSSRGTALRYECIRLRCFRWSVAVGAFYKDRRPNARLHQKRGRAVRRIVEFSMIVSFSDRLDGDARPRKFISSLEKPPRVPATACVIMGSPVVG